MILDVNPFCQSEMTTSICEFSALSTPLITFDHNQGVHDAEHSGRLDYGKMLIWTTIEEGRNVMMFRHARARAQQRAIPPIVLNCLFEYGTETRHKGATTYFSDKTARKNLKRGIGALPYKRLSDLLDAYAVVSDEGTVITVGKRL